jgi:hypothetical protein
VNAAADIARDLDGLSRLSERLLGLALRHADRIEALADDEDERAVARSRACEGAARSYRQTLALKARLRREAAERERIAQARTAAADRPAFVYEPIARQVPAERALRALIWSEHEGEEAEALEDELCDALTEAFEEAGFERLSLDEQVRRIARRMGLACDPAEEPETGEAAPAPEPEVRPEPQPLLAAEPGRVVAPDPPPRPYLPPWERAPPGFRFPGGTGW